VSLRPQDEWFKSWLKNRVGRTSQCGTDGKGEAVLYLLSSS